MMLCLVLTEGGGADEATAVGPAQSAHPATRQDAAERLLAPQQPRTHRIHQGTEIVHQAPSR